jgi:hypothetical protein
LHQNHLLNVTGATLLAMSLEAFEYLLIALVSNQYPLANYQRVLVTFSPNAPFAEVASFF